MIKKYFLFLILFSILSCGQHDKNAEAVSVNASLIDIIPENNEIPPPPPPKEENENTNSEKNKSADSVVTISKKLIKNGEMGIAVANINQAKKDVEEIIKKYKSYSQSETFRNSETSENLSMVIRIPHQNFDQVIHSFSSGIGAVEFKNISADDVTEEYTNVSIKLANKKIYLEKYRDLLRGARTTKDMLEIQENIRGLEEEIDVAEGKLRFIDDRVNFSTLKLELFKEKPRDSITSKIGFGSRFVDSIANGWNGFVSFLLGIVSFWPFFLLLPLLIFGFRKWRNRKK